MNEEVFELEKRFQPYLLKNDYTFVGPKDQSLLEPFIKNVNMIAPVVAFSRELRHALDNKQAIRKACNLLPQGTKLRVYVIIDNKHGILAHGEIEEYCRQNKIDFEI
ncbi:hypothetical protein FLA105534_04928 [Flavobacterium bizetiae]|uniref:Uncharacterized protein n=1 Tax=Flavobacterium bizetiae TaxID=2704140 RepID=A0A6J4GZU3_9FLAO|nr:hypothetical protein [Flavobacterium bizetiae]CAA9203746.1 hypothetical protein FLA105534_04928 [Flavobacterium bizetiae]CAD5343028.1 hypothetical protein FLA105535_03026 [Flavobacterium bizetiae]CAD5350441.1 hypothetical protein FLA105534_04431 [Flavobacterium bizetiae]